MSGRDAQRSVIARRSRTSRDAGFTLIEMMIVVTISGVVTAGLSTLYVRAHTQQVGDHAAALMPLRAQTVLGALRRDLRAAAGVRLESNAVIVVRHQPGAPEVRYALKSGLLIRQSGTTSLVLARLLRFEVRRRGPRLLAVSLAAERELVDTRRHHTLRALLAIGGPR